MQQTEKFQVELAARQRHSTHAPTNHYRPFSGLHKSLQISSVHLFLLYHRVIVIVTQHRQSEFWCQNFCAILAPVFFNNSLWCIFFLCNSCRVLCHEIFNILVSQFFCNSSARYFVLFWWHLICAGLLLQLLHFTRFEVDLKKKVIGKIYVK